MKKDLISFLRTAFAIGAYFTKDSIDEFNNKKVTFTSQSSVCMSLSTILDLKIGYCKNWRSSIYKELEKFLTLIK